MISTILRGGLGNNLFQMSQCIAHALRHDLEYAIPKVVENPHYPDQKPYIFSGVNYCDKVPNLPHYAEVGFAYNDIPLVDNVVFDGYWQSHKYWCDYDAEIKQAFGFNYARTEGWCAIHVRRGDYMKLPEYHPFVGEDFLKHAVFEMNNRTGIAKFMIFSNDMLWCKGFFGTIPEYDFVYFESGSELADLEIGSWCEHQILSNGTFALWMYYLNQNPNKICIAPKRWFGEKLDHDTSDVYPPNAIKL